MSLKKTLNKNQKEKLKFIDENLTAEEISNKLWNMNLEEQGEYIHKQLSPQKKLEFIKYTINLAREENKKCIQENRKNIFDYYDIGHP